MFNSVFTILLLGCIVAICWVLGHRIKQLPLRRIPGPRSISLLTGNYKQLFHVAAGPFHEKITKTYGRVIRLTGFLGDTQLMISDPMALAFMLVKEQDAFEEPLWFTESNRHIFGSSLLATMGSHHRKQRKLLNPAFSGKNLCSITPLFQSLTRQVECILYAKVSSGPQEVDILDLLGRLALEAIAQAGLGYTFGSLSGEENQFGLAIKEYLPTMSKLSMWRTVFPLVSWAGPSRLLRLVAAALPWQNLHDLIRVTDTMHRSARKVYEEKKSLLLKGDEATVCQTGEGKDIISILLKANMSASEDARLPDEEIIAQMGTLVFAGTDTTSSATARLLHVLALHPEEQERLRQELITAWASGDQDELSYDVLVGLPYLDAICRETMRLYPPATLLNRVCRQDISVPLSQPITTSQGPLSSIFIPKSTGIILHISAINCDRSIWGADAQEWKPDRWLAPLPESVKEAHIPGIYSNTLTFNGGGRACIGFKFAQLEMKVVLALLIKSFRFSISNKEEVFWRFGVISTPSVKGSHRVKPELPLIVERLRTDNI
ncbi:cytochrome P450 [Artomyces pyxidatus]|uniref:Cytochrome P450 n=1 Tax=Artomyces pyxidatus TaxID=48021 RepID=A0ACB8SL83_9AGAM|nr:cytochrome P450 [Artomyces pyxidatus]